ncbi:Uncharacterised protein [Listeria ivanovii subsp. londoniensis]|uniref:DUF5082 domain-containing protein n=2 Tax=Listeria ivanovii TaxID=1638 RepID=A0ABS1G224_LISIV|nr:hypothetical protein [Listeria ivanovii]EFR98504.1 conserved hypothetical protein [Listeria ivanovii FSL F6-596]AIS58561.1 hypothetical protein JL58_00490 [Listeria ivanovii subsp. londoniensis]MBK1960917.1 DUF5082 domain-containing protein [Listeria ivanovii subsp. londoniensis]SDW05599.1 hypothetical protein SAMN05421782_101248 [Listeria ivanovii]VEH44507.1 Uncharacterised protein [Listeria ivanovii subsp. londoniensis]
MSTLSDLTRDYNNVLNDITSLKSELNIISDKADRLRIAAAEMQYCLEEIADIDTSLGEIKIDGSIWEGDTKKANESILEDILKINMTDYHKKVADIYESYTNEIRILYQQYDNVSLSLQGKKLMKSQVKSEIKKEKESSDE